MVEEVERKNFYHYFNESILNRTAELLAKLELRIDGIPLSQEKSFLIDVLLELRRISDKGKDLISLFGLGSDVVSLKETQGSLKNLFDEVKERFNDVFQRKNQQCIVYVDDLVPQSLRGNFEALRRVLYCIIENATQYTPPGGGIILLATVEKTFEENFIIKVNVSDSGFGIPDYIKHRVTLPFRRGDETLSSRGGIGLGLAVASDLLSRINSSLQIESLVGRGTSVSASIHFKMGEATSETLHEGLTEPQHKSLTILVVDDIITNRIVLTRQLTNLGYSVIEACNGLEAVTLYKNTDVDIIFMDVAMPEMDGMQATSVIRELEIEQDKLKKTHIFSYSTFFNNPSVDTDPSDYGFDGVLTKPFTKSQLREVLKRVEFEQG